MSVATSKLPKIKGIVGVKSKPGFAPAGPAEHQVRVAHQSQLLAFH